LRTFFICTPEDNVPGKNKVGSVYLIQKDTYSVLGSVIGDDANDEMCSGNVYKLPNGNIAIVSPNDNVNGITKAGSITFMNGFTGAVISKIAGEQSNESLGSMYNFRVLNGNYITADNTNEGSLTLWNVADGTKLLTVDGELPDENLGSVVYALKNGNFVLGAPRYTHNGKSRAGRMFLINGSTGAIIKTHYGNTAMDNLGSQIYELENGNFLAVSTSYNLVGKSSAGAVMLFDGTSGDLLASHYGDRANELFGSGGQVRVLNNGRYAVGSLNASPNNIATAGAVFLYDSSNGDLVGSFLGETANDRLATIHALDNGNFTISSSATDVNNVADVGMVKLINGTDGTLINTYSGSVLDDKVGTNLTILPGSKFHFTASAADIDNVTDSGLFMLIDGQSGNILSKLSGENANDKVGSSAKVDKDLMFIRSVNEQINGVPNLGTVRIVDVATGSLLGIVEGSASQAITNSDPYINESHDGKYIFLGLNQHPYNGMNKAGIVQLIPLD
jgi:hypothetical protein